MMRLLFVFILSTFSLSVLACPNFAGVYLCSDSQGGNYSSTITQTIVEGATHYLNTTGEEQELFIADGQWRMIEDAEGDLKMQVVCGEKQLQINILGLINQSEIKSQTLVSLDSRGNLISTTESTYAGQNLPTSTETCIKQ